MYTPPNKLEELKKILRISLKARRKNKLQLERILKRRLKRRLRELKIPRSRRTYLVKSKSVFDFCGALADT